MLFSFEKLRVELPLSQNIYWDENPALKDYLYGLIGKDLKPEEFARFLFVTLEQFMSNKELHEKSCIDYYDAIILFICTMQLPLEYTDATISELEKLYSEKLVDILNKFANKQRKICQEELSRYMRCSDVDLSLGIHLE